MSNETKTLLAECCDMVQEMVGQNYLYFDTAVDVKLSPHHPAFAAWAVCVSPDKLLYVMDNNEEWHLVQDTGGNTSLVIASLYQRLKLLRINYAKA